MSKNKKDNLEKVNETDMTVTNSSGEQSTFDLNDLDVNQRYMFDRALEHKREQVKLETRLFESQLLQNEYVDRLYVMLQEKSNYWNGCIDVLINERVKLNKNNMIDNDEYYHKVYLKMTRALAKFSMLVHKEESKLV